MPDYDVALWLRPPKGTSIPYRSEVVQAPDPLQAVLLLMHRYCLVEVGYAAAHLVGTAEITRYYQVELFEDEGGNLQGGYLS
ncbi:hypothetical protein KSC_086790 [Ktedonobacter sp. SOSP1-52]|uniref:hypothetical protein n=1 Tax=Ktedonobacter sp. SOSP1-52 TaxID=2778366 RepID=UPI001915A2DF|nr:hypothetical protein [Ktedonobacter sp. SOSP1-52]GHO69787.1 hypothetical protein KSC_086790 [Ktedonobacter sp. SOSP1-52]